MMKPVIIIGAVVLLAACKSSQKTASATAGGNWQETKIVIDGNDGDWKKPMLFSEGKEGIAYSVTNDADSLYICLKTSSDPLQMKIQQSGLTLWVNADGKKKETAAIHFPISSGNKTNPVSVKPGERRDISSMKNATAFKLNGYSLSGFLAGDGAYAYNVPNEAHINVKLDYNADKELVYEAAIPFTAIYAKNASSLSEKPSAIAIGIYVQGLPQPEMSAGGMPGGGMGAPPGGGGGGMMGPPGGGMNGGGGNMEEMQKMFSDTKFWKIIPVATK